VARDVLIEAAKAYGVNEEKLYSSPIEKPVKLERRILDRIHDDFENAGEDSPVMIHA